MPTYYGFSTYNRARKFKINDLTLIKQDLFNHFHIRRGEKLMNPNFGTIIWDVLFEPFTETTQKLIADDVKKIVNYDPRLRVEDVAITEFTDGIQIEIALVYVLENQVDNLSLRFDRNTRSLTTG
jgi:phage baseplate assembly protein W